MSTRRSLKGFTIVELLIVIVVIAILATISIVAYNGIQDRANNSQTISGVASYIKALKAYAAKNGAFPVHTNFPCLGDVGTTCGTTGSCWGIGWVGGQQAFKDSLNDVIAGMPGLSKQQMTCSAGGAIATGGFYYSAAPGTTAWIYYFLKGNVDCGAPAGLNTGRTQGENTTYCNGFMTAS